MTQVGELTHRNGELKTVGRAVQVLNSFLKQDLWGASALARHLGLSKTIVHRLLTTLAATGMLDY